MIEIRKLHADEIECRIGTVTNSQAGKQGGCSLLLYKDARVDMRILDETFGPFNWTREHTTKDGRLYCTVSVYDETKNAWISKEDVGTESNTEKEKGQASDAFKRACFNWGIGRELYTAPFIWIVGGDRNIKAHVKEIGYDNKGNINKLIILNSKTGQTIFNMGGVIKPAPTPVQAAPAPIADEMQTKINQCNTVEELSDLFKELDAPTRNQYKNAFTTRKNQLI